jgi:hypothetical protein
MRRALLLALGTAAWTSPALAQGSAFALRGLGWAGRPVTARTAGVAGAFAAFDPAMGMNPAAMGRWRSVGGWAVGAPTRRSFDGPLGTATNETVRFPLIGFAAPTPYRVVVGLTISDYLDRSYALALRDTTNIRGQDETYTDAARSVGGVTDIRLGASYRAAPRFMLGAGLHFYTGSTRLSTQRVFDNSNFLSVLITSNTDFRAIGASFGALAQPLRRLELGASVKLTGNLRSSNSTGATAGATAWTPMPLEAGGGLRLELVPGVLLAGTAQWAGWSRADSALRAGGGDGARDTWSLGVGAEAQGVKLIRLRTPLRAGYRWRQLPFLSLGQNVDEEAWSAGFGFQFASDRAAVDVAYEDGSRTAGPTKETFTTVFVGITIRP